MIQFILVTLCVLCIKYFDTPVPDNQQYPEMFVTWWAIRIFTVGIFTTCITGILDSRDREGFKVPWYRRVIKFCTYSAVVALCTFIAQFVDVVWFNQWWGSVLTILPFIALMSVLFAGKTILEPTDEVRDWF